MGFPYVPFTFPTITVQNNAKQSLVDLTTAEVDRIWVSYKKAMVDNKMTPYNAANAGKNGPLIQFLISDTGFTPMKIVGWLNALQKAVDQGWGPVWLDPAAYAETNILVNPTTTIKSALANAGEDVKAFLTPAAEPVTNLIKYAAVAVVAGAVVYGIYQWNKGRKRRK